MSSPNCHWEGCGYRHEVDSLLCFRHRLPDRAAIEEALLTILAAFDKRYWLAAAVPGVSDLAPDEVAALRAGRALFGIVDKEG